MMALLRHGTRWFMSSDETLRNPDQFPDEQATLILQGLAGDLEAMVDVPEPGEETLPAVAIICHPRTEDGGTLHSKVVQMIERSLREMGLRTVRFNFRGVGASDGEFDNGFGETDDLLTVANWVRSTCGDDEVWLAGYGFGCFVTARAAQKLPIEYLLSIAPPVAQYDFASLPRPPCPWLVIQGDEDTEVNPDSVYQWAESMDEPPQLIKMQEAGHSFHRRLMDLRGVIKNGIRRQKMAPSQTE
jgi:alpha/beta superfamily hydrolase